MITSIENKNPLVLDPQTLMDQCAEILNLIANVAKAAFWKAEEYLQYVFLPLRPGLQGQENSRVLEIVKRTLIILPAFTATVGLMPVALLGHCFTGLSNRMHSREFVYLEGRAAEVTTRAPKIMHLNVCMFAGGLPYAFGGVSTAGERFDRLLRLIRDEDPDICFLCEFSETLTPRLYEGLKDRYKHFFVNIGSNALGMDASLCALSRVPLVREPKFIPFKATPGGEQKMMVRGYFVMETANYSYLYTHLHANETEASEKIRIKQLQEIRQVIEPPKNWIILGDFNMKRGGAGHEQIKAHFIDEIEREHGIIPTCAMDLPSEPTEESLDYILTSKEKPVSLATKVIDTYVHPGNALSDHKAFICLIK